MLLSVMKKLLFILLFFHCLAAFAQSQVEPYLVMAAANNPALKASFNEFMSSLESIPQAKGLPDPQLTFGYFIQPIETRVGAQRANLELSQTFPWFGSLRAREAVACMEVEAKLAAFQDSKIKLFQQVRISYNELYYLKKAIELTEENLQLLQSFQELARVNFESGKTGFVNVLRVEMEEKELRATLNLLRESRKSSLKAFKNLVNSPVEAMIFPDTLELVPLDIPNQYLPDSLVVNNRQLRELRFQSEAGQELIEVARFKSMPSFSVGVNYTIIDQRTGLDLPENGKNALVFPQVGMSIPLFRKKYQALQNQAALDQQTIQFEIEDKTNQFNTELEYLLRDHSDGQRRLTLYQELLYLAERSLSLLQTEFTTGKVDFEEVIRMERKLSTYQLAVEKARVDVNNAVHKINYITGHEKFEF